MIKKIILILAAAIVIGGIVAFFVTRAEQNGSGTSAGGNAGAGASSSSAASTPLSGAPAGMAIPQGATIQIGTPQGVVTVNNFYHNIVASEDEFLILAETSDYEITYDTMRSAFYLQFSVVSSSAPSAAAPTPSVRTAGEDALLQILGIGTSDACKLNALEAPPQNSPLSFCGAFQ